MFTFEITTVGHKILRNGGALQMGKLEKIKALRKSRDLSSLVHAASEILNNPIAMFDVDYTLIAHTYIVTDDPIWNELVTYGTFSSETQGLFADMYFTYLASKTEKMVILKSELLKYDRVLAYVHNKKNIRVANLVMVACNAMFDADDLIAFSAFADKLTSKIREDEYFTKYGYSFIASIITKLLDSVINDTQIYAPHLAMLFDGFDMYLYLAVICIGQRGGPQGMPEDENEGLEGIRDLLTEKYNSFKFATYSGYIIAIMSSKQSNFNCKRVLGKYADFFEQHDLYAGVSKSFENLYQLRKYYSEAVTALKRGCKSCIGGSGNINDKGNGMGNGMGNGNSNSNSSNSSSGNNISGFQRIYY